MEPNEVKVNLDERRRRVTIDITEAMAKLNKLLEQAHALDLRVDIDVQDVMTLDRPRGRKILNFSVYKLLSRGGSMPEGL